jgi:hypothetical protein
MSQRDTPALYQTCPRLYRQGVVPVSGKDLCRVVVGAIAEQNLHKEALRGVHGHLHAKQQSIVQSTAFGLTKKQTDI